MGVFVKVRPVTAGTDFINVWKGIIKPEDSACLTRILCTG